MGDATQCARCQRRTVGEFCGSCVKVHAEVEELAARFIGPVITAEVMRNRDPEAQMARLRLALMDEQAGSGDAPSSEESDRRRALVQIAFDYAETFVEMRNERRRRA